MSKMREQELKFLPLSKKLDNKSYKCSKCGANIESEFAKWLHKLTGIPFDKLKNGDGQKELYWKMQIAERTMTIAGIEINESIITEKTLQYVEKLLGNRLSEEEREKNEKEKDLLKEEITEMNEKTWKMNSDYEKLETEYSELKAKMKSNPALKGGAAQVDLLEDLEGIFPDQHFEDISNKGNGDILWSDIQINIGRWTLSGIGGVIDSKDKERITEHDINKLLRDMKFHKKEIGLIIATKQDQLRIKEMPCGIYRTEEGYLLVTSRENFNHHIAIKFVRDVLARVLSELKEKEQEKYIDITKLNTILNDIMKTKEYHRKIKTKAHGIISDSDEADAYLEAKLQEAYKTICVSNSADKVL